MNDGVDTTVVAAFAVGFVSFISPCVLPLVPGYLSTISGMSFVDIQEGRNRSHILIPALIFCASFSVMFILLGLTATGIGQTLQDNRALLRQISGAIIIGLGVFFIATLFVPAFNREFRPTALLARARNGGPVIAGLAFAVAWLPCTGPTLGVILTAAGNQDTVGKGAVLLAFYSAGLEIPFLACALAVNSMVRVFRFFRDHYRVITVVAGLTLIAMGVLLWTNDLTRLNSWANDIGLNLIQEL